MQKTGLNNACERLTKSLPLKKSTAENYIPKIHLSSFFSSETGNEKNWHRPRLHGFQRYQFSTNICAGPGNCCTIAGASANRQRA